IDAEMLDQRLLEFDMDIITSAIDADRDLLFQYQGVQILTDRYLIQDRQHNTIELPQWLWMRVAMGLAIQEPASAEPGASREERAIEFYNTMSAFRYIPSTPTLFSAGTNHPQLSSCFLNTTEDSLEGIFKVFTDNARLSKWSGGLGTDWTNVRATNAHIKGTNGKSQGLIPWLKIDNDVAVAVNQGGKRKGAHCAYLETWHMDIEEFLELRKNVGDERRRTHDINSANWIPDLFMKRVADGGQWTLFTPDQVPELHDLVGKAFEEAYVRREREFDQGQLLGKRMEAKDLWRKMLTMLFETGHPWITFKDPCNLRSPQDHVGVVHSSNLCTEITLNTSPTETAVCNLGSINLANHVTDGVVDYDKLQQTVRTAVRMLDNVIDINYYPTPEAKQANLTHRAIGLGAMGYQDMLYQLNVPFNSDAHLQLADELFEHISYFAISTSSDLAEERGAYPSFKGSKWDRGLFPLDTLTLLEEERGVPIECNRTARLDWTALKARVAKVGMRNSNTMAVAPTATIANIIGVMPSIEPTFRNLFVQSNLSGEFTVINHWLVSDLETRGLWSREMAETLKAVDGQLDLIADMPEDLVRKYPDIFAIDQEWLVDACAMRGKWIDQAQSLNLFVAKPSGKFLNDIYTRAWHKGLKTTYYLRSLGASQVEKATVDQSKYGRTHKRDGGSNVTPINEAAAEAQITASAAQQCRIDNGPDCEACQ
ncbi:MAG: ribonucleoside-diphosphate reductase subunit alpha, partial [Cyanobacteria bacterium HKST-UBA03]|nr:ribonucleoside-diphosphate reductase subunit alpha [Cyanobacteria bacterium HKST-UBA03]